MKKFTILGTGWLGFSLAQKLKNEYLVKVSYRNKEKETLLKKEGLIPFFLDENNLGNLDKLLDTNYLFINFPPSKSKDYLEFLRNIYKNKNIKSIEKIIFISSTSIYSKEDGVYIEESQILNPSNKIVYEAEKLVEKKTDVIFRCSGLMGNNRIAGRYFSNKIVDNANDKINYVHRDDVIKATNFVIKNKISGIFNLCSKIHPSKKKIYSKNALKFNFDLPIFKETKEEKNRIINGNKIEKLGFEYKFPNPLRYD